MWRGDEETSSTVSFQLFGDPEELQVYRDLVADYTQQTGNEIEMIEVADREAHLQKLTTSFAGGEPPDVFLINYRNYGGYADRGVIDPVEPRLDTSDELARDEFYPEPLEAFTYEGQLKCMPQNVSSLVVYYNRDLFREAGLAGPGARLDVRRHVRRRVASSTRRNVHGLGVEPGVVRVAPFVWSAGGELVDDPTAPTRFTLDTPEARGGLEAFLDLAEFGPSHEEYEAKSLDEQFLDGEVAMFMSSRREVPTFRTIEDFEWDVAPFPVLAERAGVLHSDAYCLAKGENADAAWEFVEFAAGTEGQRLTAEGGRTVPSLESVANSDAFLDPGAPPRVERGLSRRGADDPAAADLAELGRGRGDRRPRVRGGVLRGGVDVDEALERINQETEGEL